MKKGQETIGSRIKDLREKQKLTQARLGEELLVTDKTVSKWEKGKSEPDADSMVRIAAFFGVTLDYLLTGTTKVTEEPPMSKIELACKNDDIALLGDVNIDVPDETGRGIDYYAEIYDAKRIKRYLEENSFGEMFPVLKGKNYHYVVCALRKGVEGEENLELLGTYPEQEQVASVCAEKKLEGYHGFRVFWLLSDKPAKFDYQTFCIEYLNREGYREMRIRTGMLDDEKSGLLVVEFFRKEPHDGKEIGPDGTEIIKRYSGYGYRMKSYIAPAVMKEFMDLLSDLEFHHWEARAWGCALCNACYVLAGDTAAVRMHRYLAPGEETYKKLTNGLLSLCLKSMEPSNFSTLASRFDPYYDPHYRKGYSIDTIGPFLREIEREAALLD